jgi:hypothetical protein
MTSQTQSNIQVTLLLLLLFCPVSEVATSRAENNTRLGNTFFITSMYLGVRFNQSGSWNWFNIWQIVLRPSRPSVPLCRSPAAWRLPRTCDLPLPPALLTPWRWPVCPLVVKMKHALLHLLPILVSKEALHSLVAMLQCRTDFIIRRGRWKHSEWNHVESGFWPNLNNSEWKDSEWKDIEKLLAQTGITQNGKTQNG